MNNIIKHNWLRALKTDKYKKGCGIARQTTSKGELCHCALGVLAEQFLATPMAKELGYSWKNTPTNEPYTDFDEILHHTLEQDSIKNVFHLMKVICKWAKVKEQWKLTEFAPYTISEINDKYNGETDKFSESTELLEAIKQLK